MIFRRKNQETKASAGWETLQSTVRAHMADADEELVRIISAVAGLLACIAYADRQYTDSEREHIRRELSRVHDLTAAGVDAICELLDERMLELTATAAHAYTRDLRELASHEMRLEVLEVLVDLAAADEDLSMAETDMLRRTATLMGLSQQDYVAAQQRHRHRLSVLDE